MESVVDLTYVTSLRWSLAYVVYSFAYICISLDSRGEMEWCIGRYVHGWAAHHMAIWLVTRLKGYKGVAEGRLR
jgi:hypothetical protein